MEPTNNPVPKHVAIIMDGNRRFAKRIMMKPWKGHEWGAKKLEEILFACKELGIKELTVYAFSLQNFDRPKNEFEELMRIAETEFKSLLKDSRIRENQIKINFLGRLFLFPNKIQKLANKLAETTKNNTKFVFNIAMAYGGREEVLEAVYRLASEVKDGKLEPRQINEDVFEKQLYTKSPPDLVIRTGGEKRTSNFLLWQAAYSEWIFYEKKMWPEFEKEDLIECVEEYKKRQRRFGK